MKIGNFHIGFDKRSVVQGDGTDWLGGYNPNGAPKVDETTVLNLSAVWSCVRLLSESVSGLPCALKETTSTGIDTVKNHPINDLFKNGMVNDYMSSLSFMELGMVDSLLRGNFYAVIERDQNANPVRLIPINEKAVTIVKYDNEIVYKIKTDKNERLIDSVDMFHLKGLSTNGISGVSVISAFKDGFGLSLSAQKYGKEFFDNGTNLDGYITIAGKLTDEAKKSIREGWNNNYNGLGKSKTAILDGGTEYKQLGMKPEDAQYLGTREFQAVEIGRWFRIPSHMINIGDRATYNNIEAYATEFVQYSLMPWIRRIETEVNNKLLRESEKGKRFFKFNVNGLLRGDSAARASFYKSGLTDRWLTPDDVRKFEDLNPIEGGDKVAWPMNMIPADKVEDWINSMIENKNGKENNNPPA